MQILAARLAERQRQERQAELDAALGREARRRVRQPDPHVHARAVPAREGRAHALRDRQRRQPVLDGDLDAFIEAYLQWRRQESGAASRIGSPSEPRTPTPRSAMGTARGRWVIAAAVLGSGVAFLDGSVVNAALPAIARGPRRRPRRPPVGAHRLPARAGLVPRDRRIARRPVRSPPDVPDRARRVRAASLLCGVAPSVVFLIGARGAPGRRGRAARPREPRDHLGVVRGPTDRARAIGAWSGLAGVATAFGPFLGGWLIDSVLVAAGVPHQPPDHRGHRPDDAAARARVA